jgi:hypothetical protein
MIATTVTIGVFGIFKIHNKYLIVGKKKNYMYTSAINDYIKVSRNKL